MTRPDCSGRGYRLLPAIDCCGEIDLVKDPCEGVTAKELAAEEAYQRSVMASARAQFAADRPYLRMAREAGRVIETQAECEGFTADVAEEVV